LGGRRGGSLTGAAPRRRRRRGGGAHRRSSEEVVEEGSQLVVEVAGARVVLGEAPVRARDGRSDPSMQRASVAMKSMVTHGVAVTCRGGERVSDSRLGVKTRRRSGLPDQWQGRTGFSQNRGILYWPNSRWATTPDRRAPRQIISKTQTNSKIQIHHGKNS
jgi:hypothetical protein